MFRSPHFCLCFLSDLEEEASCLTVLGFHIDFHLSLNLWGIVNQVCHEDIALRPFDVKIAQPNRLDVTLQTI